MPFPACPCSAGMIPHPSLLWPCVQQSHNFVTTEGNTMHLANCIWWHVKCIQHMPYSIFITLHRLKSHDSAHRKWILHVMEYNSTVQCICSNFNCTTEQKDMAHRKWISDVMECIIQQYNVSVATLIAPLNCIWHMPYSMFLTLHWLTSHELKGYGTQKMHLTCYGMWFNNAKYLQWFAAMQKQLPKSNPSINCYFTA
jgi:hypothetical protein